MNLGIFVRKNRSRWQRLESMLGFVETRGPVKTDRSFLRELTSLYRATTGDLAFAQTHYRGTTLLLFLHQLVARAHNQIYRPHRFTSRAAKTFFLHEIPRAVRGHLQSVAWSAIIFLMGIALGISAVQFDERAASLVLPPHVLNSIYSGKMWTGDFFSAFPGSTAPTFFITNNIAAAFWIFAGGLSFGLLTTLFLFENGLMLGCAFKLCTTYGLSGLFLEYVAAHGFLELSAMILAGAGGYVVANALLNPGSYSRRDALAQNGRSAVRMAVACVPALVTAGCIEAFISPSTFPVWIKVVVGLTLGISFWLYLLITGKSRAAEQAAG